jgi:putative DNA primase/helicase
MSITSTDNAAKSDTTIEYALAIHKLGFNVLPMRLDHKSPTLTNWKPFISRPQNTKEIQSFQWENTNIGIINGVNGHRSIDIDQCDNVEILFKVLELLGLDPGYEWVVASPGKGGGFHIHLLCSDELTITNAGTIVGKPKIKDTFDQIELRWKNCITMFPSSIHPDTHTPYAWAFGTPQTPLATVPIQVIESAYRALTVPQSKHALEPTKSTEEKKLPPFDAWAQRALEQELSIIRTTTEGNRNAQLNRSAYALGQIVGSGLLEIDMVTAELSRAGTTAGLNEREITSTIKSGLEAGMKKPRMPKQVFKENEPKLKLKPRREASDEKIASFSFDDQGHAEAVYYLYDDYLAFNGEYGWMIWDGTHYVPSVQRINTIIVEVLRRRMKAAAHLERAELAKISRAMASTVSATRSMLENLALIKIEEFDDEPDLINCLNGIVNLRTKKLIPHDTSYRFTWCSNVNYNSDADGSLWLEFISKTVEQPEMVDYLKKSLGYSLTGYIREECLFYIFGPPRSGKGTMTETILSILPRPIAMEVDFNTFTQKREGDNQNFDLAPMKAARLVFASESNKYQSLNPAKVKALTGGNEVSCAFKHHDMFNYRPQYAVWLSSNHEVNGDAEDDALWGRVKVIHFPNSQLGREDKSLKWRMQSSQNLEAVLAWMVDGAYEWYRLGDSGLQTPQAVTDLTNNQRNAQDSVGLWIDECVERDEDAWTSNAVVRTSYENWCEANGYDKPKQANSFSRSLTAHRFKVGEQRRDAGEKVRGVLGLRIL